MYLDVAIPDDKMDYSECKKNGHPTDYARMHPAEDSAELGELAEVNPMSLSKDITDAGEDKRFENKTRKLIEGGSLDPSILDYMALKKLYSHSFGKGFTIKCESGLELFINSSEEFLENYPNSVYGCEVRNLRGNVYANIKNVWDHEKTYNPLEMIEQIQESMVLARTEYENAINSDFKPKGEYSKALRRLSEISMILGDHEESKIYRQAKREHLRRYNNGSWNLAEVGVADFLEKRLRMTEP